MDFAIDFEAVGSGITDFGNKRSESTVAVVGVQVDVELTAARIESAVACEEVITIQKKHFTLLFKIIHYPEFA